MLVILETRCGCGKKFDTTEFPPTECYIVPLKRGFNLSPTNPMPADNRRFKIREFDNRGQELSTVVYEEME
jgi:hypothetical protein